MAKKTSANAKAAYSRYSAEGTAAKNKAARAERHSKLHPNDKGSKTKGGRTQNMEARPTQFEAKIGRAVRHFQLFEQEVQVKGRKLSTSAERKTFLDSLKAKPSVKKAA